MCPVTDIRNQDDPLESHSMYYEQHGSGPDKLVLIMGYVLFLCCVRTTLLMVYLQTEQQLLRLVRTSPPLLETA